MRFVISRDGSLSHNLRLKTKASTLTTCEAPAQLFTVLFVHPCLYRLDTQSAHGSPYHVHPYPSPVRLQHAFQSHNSPKMFHPKGLKPHFVSIASTVKCCYHGRRKCRYNIYTKCKITTYRILRYLKIILYFILSYFVIFFKY